MAKLRRSPTALTLATLKEQGWQAENVEKRLPYANTTKDLFGFIDVLAVRAGEVLAIQCTSRGHISTRLKKIKAAPTLKAVLMTGWRIEVWGWRLAPETDLKHDVKIVNVRYELAKTEVK